MKKRLMAVVLMMAMAMSMGACGSKTAETTAAPAAEAEETEAAAEAAETEAAAEAGTATEGAALNAADYESLDPITITVASAAASANTIYSVMEEVANEVTEATGGKLTFDLVWDGALGSDSELINSCIMGDVDAIFVATSSYSNTCPEMAIFDAPGLFTNITAANEAAIQMTEVLNPVVEAKGLHMLALGCNNFRGLSTNIELTSAESFKGMKVRTPENKYYTAFYTNLGCQPTPLPFPELYTALQQGLVDAQDNPIEGVYATKFYEVQDYYLAPCAITYVFPTTINLDKWNALDPAYQAALTYFGEEYARRCAENQPVDAANAAEAMKDDLTVLPMTDDIQAAITAAGEPILDMLREDLGSELVDQYVAIAESLQ